jgi:2-iminobutanoate/2-iminopropanoate deaminase
MKRIITTKEAPAAVGPYSQAVVAGGFVYVSGQIALTSEGKLIESTVEEETIQIMRNLEAILKAAGADFSNVVKANIYLTDISTFSKVNQTYSKFLQEPYPARECVGVQSLPLGARVEVSMIAAVSGSS